MRRLSSERALGPAMLLMLLAATSAFAGDAYLLKTMPGGTTWDAATYWSNGAAAAAGTNYYVGRDATGNIPADVTYPAGAPVELRTPQISTPASFPGDSLTIDTSGSLKIKTSANVTFPDLRFRGTRPTFFCGDAAIKTFDGKITNSATPLYLYVGDSAPRGMVFNCRLTGAGDILVDARTNPGNNMELNNDANDFTGNISTDTGLIIVDTAKSLGKCGILAIGGAGTLQVKADITAPLTLLNLYGTGRMTLDHIVRVGSARIAGTNLADGTYSAATLAASYPGNITDGGGQLIVTTPAPKIAVSPAVTTVTFSSLNVMIQAGDKATQTVTVTNNGALDLAFTKQGSEANQGLVLTGSSFYKIKSVSQATTLPLTPGSSLTITLEFSGATQADYNPVGNNTKTAKLSIFSNDSSQSRVDLGLTGATTVPVRLSSFAAQ